MYELISCGYVMTMVTDGYITVPFGHLARDAYSTLWKISLAEEAIDVLPFSGMVLHFPWPALIDEGNDHW